MLAGSAESRAHVGYKIFSPSLLVREDGIVLVLKVPVAQESHHHSQPVELARAHKWIVPPVPGIFFLLPARMSLKACSINMARRDYVALSAVQEGGKFLYCQIRDVVIVIGEVANSPQQPSCNDFRLRFNSQLGLPFRPIRVLDVKFG